MLNITGLDITGAILAGGQSRRMGGGHKALQPLAGRPLLGHVMARLKPQCHRLLLSVERVEDCWNEFGLSQVADQQAGSQGPLGGVLAALEATADEQPGWLLLAPCDAPFLPLDLATRLVEAAEHSGASGAMVSYRQQWQPTFSLWHTRLLPELRTAVLEQEQRGLKEFLRARPVAVVEWASSGPELHPDPFFNINTPEDLATAAALLDQPAVPIS
jgi:molybdopterin-guanine dinucleotide biosynthesis protein A